MGARFTVWGVEMKFYFENMTDFIWMSGHGPYVWSCYGVTFAAFLGLWWWMRLQMKSLVHEQQLLAARDEQEGY